ncbi:MAG: DUF3450 domain-containing protein [Deltaproteobacteria bacterium]|nr:DUF3450 domain-containing protein [Deltaproteobacteria bacterium]
MSKINRLLKNLSLIAILFLVSMRFSVIAAEGPQDVQETGKKVIGVYQEIQLTEGEWQESRETQENRYNNLKKQIESLLKKKELLQNKIEALSRVRSEAEREIIETARISSELQEYLGTIIQQIEINLNAGIPFLYKERSDRIIEARNTISDPDATLAEKCRRVMETLKIETGYSNSADVYQEIIRVEEFGHNTLSVDILRIGAISLFWRSPDGQRTGVWDHAEKKWRPLPEKYNRKINQAIDIVLKRRPVELARLPIGRLVR